VGLVVAAVASIGVVGIAVFVVFSQPWPVWRDAAEHSRRFWLAWATVSVSVGLLPAVTGLLDDWGAGVWLIACCAFAALQPAMVADILEVRRDIARRRRSLLEMRRRERAEGWSPFRT
jgi:hypothetical protein